MLKALVTMFCHKLNVKVEKNINKIMRQKIEGKQFTHENEAHITVMDYTAQGVFY